MNKLKEKLFQKVSPAFAAAVLIGALALAGDVFAYQSTATQLPPAPDAHVYVAGDYIEAKGNYPIQTTAPIPTKGSQPSFGAAQGQSNFASNQTCSNNVCTISLQQQFSSANATTTITSWQDPWVQITTTASDVVLYTDAGGQGWTGSTSTVPLSRVFFTGPATTTFTATCGSATSPTAAPTHALLTVIVNTSSVGLAENNLTAANGALADGGTVPKIVIDPAHPYFNCIASSIASSTLFTSTTANAAFLGVATGKFDRTVGY